MSAHFKTIIDVLAFGIVLCDHSGRVVFTNRIAEHLAAISCGITFLTSSPSARRLTAAVLGERQSLEQMIEDVAASGVESGTQLTCDQGD